jgi:hypothetical protein
MSRPAVAPNDAIPLPSVAGGALTTAMVPPPVARKLTSGVATLTKPAGLAPAVSPAKSMVVLVGVMAAAGPPEISVPDSAATSAVPSAAAVLSLSCMSFPSQSQAPDVPDSVEERDRLRAVPRSARIPVIGEVPRATIPVVKQ